MKRLALWSIGGLICFGLGYTFVGHRIQDDEDRAYVRKELATYRGEIGKGRSQCKHAITAIAPRPVLDWFVPAVGNDYSSTATGYRFELTADFGSERVTFLCYTDHSHQVINLRTR